MFDVISDLHTGSYLYSNKFNMTFEEYIDMLIPENPSKLLVIAGDISNSNKTSEQVLNALSEYYEKILVVFGNHDLYCYENEKFIAAGNPLYRWEKLEKQMKSNDKIVFLNGTTFEYEGVVFGGTGGWYDLSYTINVLNKSISEAEKIYKDGIFDSDYIPSMKKFNWDFVQKEYKKLLDIYQKVDVMITHVPPVTDCMKEDFQKSYLSGCFYFDGEYLVENTSAKIWIFGHSHVLYDEKSKIGDVRLINQSLGYPDESPKSYYPIKQIQI